MESKIVLKFGLVYVWQYLYSNQKHEADIHVKPLKNKKVVCLK